MPYYSVLLTRDTTESARLCVEADDRDHAHEVARDHVTEDQWCLDGENYRRKADYYLGDPLNAIEEIGAAEFQAFRHVSDVPRQQSFSAEEVAALLKPLMMEIGADLYGPDLTNAWQALALATGQPVEQVVRETLEDAGKDAAIATEIGRAQGRERGGRDVENAGGAD